MSTELSASEIVTVPCRLAFPALFEPKSVSKDKPDVLKYQAVVLLHPDTDLDPFYAAIKAAMIEKFGKAIKLSAAKNPIRDCAEKDDLEGYAEGWHYINTKGGYPPTVVDQKLNKVIDAERAYPGVWACFHLKAYGWKHDTGGNGVSFSLEAVQLVKDDERFDSRREASELFEPIAGGESGAMFAGDEEDDGGDASALFE